MTTDEAFRLLINMHAIHKVLDCSSQQVRNYRSRDKQGKVSLKMKLELLNKAGFKMVQEPRWAVPSRLTYVPETGTGKP